MTFRYDEKIIMHKAKWKSLYAGGLSCTQIADKENVCRQTVVDYLKKKDIKFRGMTAFGNLDEHYFDKIDSEEKSYWLYFLAADGNLGKKDYVIQLTLSEKDKDHVYKFAKAIRSKAKISVRRRVRKGRKDTFEAHLQFKSKKMWTALVGHGVKPDKSLSLVLPDVPKSLQRHAWRGMIDGDGTIPVMTEKRYRRSSIQLYGNKCTCEKFKEFIERSVGNIEKVRQVKNNTYSVASEGKVADKIIEFLYKDAKIYLDRKYDLAMKKYRSFEDGVHKVTMPYALEFLHKNHYLKTLPVGTTNYALIERGDIIGVASIGVTSNPSVSQSVFGEQYSKMVMELRRFALRDNVKNQASGFLSSVIREVRKDFSDVWGLVSFADPERHYGIMYQAIGALYLGSINTLVISYNSESIPVGRHTADILLKRKIDLNKCKLCIKEGKLKYLIIVPKGEEEKERIKGLIKPKILKYLK